MMRVYLDAFPAAQVRVARSLRTRPPHHECPRRRRVSRENVACMQPVRAELSALCGVGDTAISRERFCEYFGSLDYGVI
jgi:hypothetical protein